MEEELDYHIYTEGGLSGKMLVVKTPDDEEDREKYESHQLNGLTANNIDQSNGYPVSGDRTGTDKNAVSSRNVVKDCVYIWTDTVADGREYRSCVQAQSIEGYI